MTPDDPPHPAPHDEVELTRRERRVLDRLEAEVSAGRARRGPEPAALLVVGLVVLAVGAIVTTPLVVATGIVLSLGALLRAGVSERAT